MSILDSFIRKLNRDILLPRSKHIQSDPSTAPFAISWSSSGWHAHSRGYIENTHRRPLARTGDPNIEMAITWYMNIIQYTLIRFAIYQCCINYLHINRVILEKGSVCIMEEPEGQNISKPKWNSLLIHNMILDNNWNHTNEQICGRVTLNVNTPLPRGPYMALS